MKAVKKLGIGILILIVLIIVISFFLPSKVHVERLLDMKAKPENVFVLVNNLKSWSVWSPWHKRDPKMDIKYGDTFEGEGASYTWKSQHPKVGEGSMTITQSKPYEYIETEMHFGDMGVSKGSYKFEPVSDGVKVTWSMDSEGKGIPWMMYVPSKYFNLFMDKMVGPDFEEGLKNLKEIAEAIPEKETIEGFEVEEKMMDKLMLLSVREKVKNKDIGMKIGQCYAMIGQYMGKNGIKETGSPLTIWHKYGETESDMEAAVPIGSEAKSEGKVVFSEIPATNAFVIKYYGSYEKTAPVYEAAYKYIQSKGKKPAGSPREIYITDPGIEKDTSKWLTEIIFPVE